LDQTFSSKVSGGSLSITRLTPRHVNECHEVVSYHSPTRHPSSNPAPGPDLSPVTKLERTEVALYSLAPSLVPLGTPTNCLGRTFRFRSVLPPLGASLPERVAMATGRWSWLRVSGFSEIWSEWAWRDLGTLLRTCPLLIDVLVCPVHPRKTARAANQTLCGGGWGMDGKKMLTRFDLCFSPFPRPSRLSIVLCPSFRCCIGAELLFIKAQFRGDGVSDFEEMPSIVGGATFPGWLTGSGSPKKRTSLHRLSSVWSPVTK